MRQRQQIKAEMYVVDWRRVSEMIRTAGFRRSREEDMGRACTPTLPRNSPKAAEGETQPRGRSALSSAFPCRLSPHGSRTQGLTLAQRWLQNRGVKGGLRSLDEMHVENWGGSISLGPGQDWWLPIHAVEVRRAMDGDTVVGLRGKWAFEWVHLLTGPTLLYEALTYGVKGAGLWSRS